MHNEDNNLKRLLKIKTPKGQSLFLWGARQTGKSSYLKKEFSESFYIDLLKTEELVQFSRAPNLLREKLLALPAEQLKFPVIIDEIQKVPELLNEVHWLIENKKIAFILCGSSARQLKKQTTNLLGGRAWLYHFYPLVSQEIPDFDLLRALQQGLIPKNYLISKEYIHEYFQAYVSTYLSEEIKNEGLVRNLASFSKFLEVASINHGETLNFSNIARDCQVSRHSVEGYYQILVDTLLGYFLYPFNKPVKRDLITASPKFYLFDVGVANYLAGQSVTELRGSVAGRSFEHFILMELEAYRGLSRKRFEMNYWRTKSGLEVDFILSTGGVEKILKPIEVKISQQVHQQDLKGLIAFCEEHEVAEGLVVSQDAAPRLLEVSEKVRIRILPWKLFLNQLWAGKII